MPIKKLPQKKYDPYAYKNMRGALGAGTAYVVMIMLVVLTAGSLMVGNIIPTTTTVTSGQEVIIATNTPEPKKNNLQLYYFPGATYTPTPTPTTPPQPDVKWGGGGGSGGGGGGSTCFPAGTKILMADKTEKNIEDVKAGDKVMGFDGNKSIAETVLELESPIRDHLYELNFADGSSVQLTNEHPLYTTQGWKSLAPEKTREENPKLVVGRLYNGDAVLHKDNRYIKIVSITYHPGNVQTYNLKKVSANNNFYANGFLAHNKGGGGGGGGGAPVGAR